MPPAFNLSQDQTLQFNLCKLSSKLTWKNQFHVSIRVFLFAKPRVAYATQRRPPTPNAHTYRLLIFKEQATNTIRPFGLDADRKTVSFVASLCQQRRSGIMGIPRMDVNCFPPTKGPSRAKTDRSPGPHRPKIGSRSQSPRRHTQVVIICNRPAFDATSPFDGVTGACQRGSGLPFRLSARRVRSFSCFIATFRYRGITAGHAL